MDDKNNDAAWVMLCVVLLVLGFSPFWLSVPELEGTTVEENGVDVFIAVHPFFNNWVGYNKTVSVVVDGRNETGICINGFFLTSYRYERDADYFVYLNVTLLKADWITSVGDFGTWKASTWPGHVGSLVEVCHLNLTEAM